ncbi:unnamed protein product [Rhizoctonia solani]|uniref:BTB domain-containing protein n=1 Tax=Rhizoctonia solani TaxID=456999 RepID=A0A8H3BRH9_9AGAM|nr:unnamed protein product [Rhizoctonia solani]
MGNTASTRLEAIDISNKEWKKRCFGDVPIVDHSEYYFPDGNIIVVVQNKAFKLYRGILKRHSDTFKDIKHDAVIIKGSLGAEGFEVLCQFLFPREIGVVPIIQPGNIENWGPIIRDTEALGMRGVRKYILNKLAEDKTLVTTKAVDFLSWMDFDDKEPGELLLQCIQVLAYRHSPLSPLEAVGLSGTMANAVALARERVRSLFYNPNYWKAQIPNSRCLSLDPRCSDGVFLAMTRQMSKSTEWNKPAPEPDLMQAALDSMCSMCRGRYASSVKQHADLEIKKCLRSTDGIEDPSPHYPLANSTSLKSCLES